MSSCQAFREQFTKVCSTVQIMQWSCRVWVWSCKISLCLNCMLAKHNVTYTPVVMYNATQFSQRGKRKTKEIQSIYYMACISSTPYRSIYCHCYLLLCHKLDIHATCHSNSVTIKYKSYHTVQAQCHTCLHSHNYSKPTKKWAWHLFQLQVFTSWLEA